MGVKSTLLRLVIGAVAVTSAEYFFKYNLLDLVKDKLQGLIARVGLHVSDPVGAVVTLAVFVGIIILIAKV